MGIRDWFRRRCRGSGDDSGGSAGGGGAAGRPLETVPYFDAPSGRVVHIPAAELRPGVVQARVEGVEGLVWVTADQLQPGEIRHPPFTEEVRAYVRRIEQAFAEHRSLSFQEWEEGFRRDANPSQEIALWLHAADVYESFAADEPSAARREDLYRVIVACLTASPEGVRHVLETAALTREEAQRVIDRYYGKGGD
jgi:hypothetical protein